MGRRNPILVIGDPIRNGVTWLSDELIRAGAHDDALGSDGFVVMAFLLSWASSPEKRAWETSAAHLSEQFGWGMNRERARRALDRCVKDHRLILRGYIRDGREVARRCAYMVCPGGRKFQDFEIAKWSKPIELASKKDREEAANMHGKRAS